ncbi:MAG: tetratricopeptide repeat protein [Chitinophagaceae bacterium]
MYRTAINLWIALFACILALSSFNGLAQEVDTNSAQQGPQQVYYDAVKAHILGDDKRSDSLLKVVIARNPEIAAPYYDRSRIAFAQSRPEDAEAYIKKAVTLNPENKWYQEQYANVLEKKNDYVGAARVYAKLAQTETPNATYLERSAALYNLSGKYKEALAQLEILKAKSSDDVDVLLNEQRIYLRMNDVDNAARVGRELISTYPKESIYYSKLIDLYENNQQPEKAKAVLEEMKQKFPTDPSLQLTLATNALKMGDTATYRKYVRKTITNKTLDAQTQLQLLGPYLGGLSSDSSQRIEALELIEKIASQHPDNGDVLLAYGRILSLNNKPELAAIQFQKAVSQNPNSFSSWEQLLYSLSSRKDADSLLKWSDKAARLFPNQALVYYLNGVGHYNKKDYPKAIVALLHAMDLEPDEKVEERSDIYTMLGDIYNTTKQYSLSDSSYSAALALNPRNATVLNNYAYYLSVRNTRLEEAAKMSKKSLEIRPGEPTFLDTYGWILYQQGKYKEAMSYIQKAIDKSPDETDPSLWEHLGAVLYKSGDKDGAVKAWEKAKANGSENENIDKMISERKLYE